MAQWGKGPTVGNFMPVIMMTKIRKLELRLNLRRLLRRRENAPAVQRTPPRAHLPWPDYARHLGLSDVLNWNPGAQAGRASAVNLNRHSENQGSRSSAFQCTTYRSTRAFSASDSESISNVNISFCT
jgi:hypothetical protein